MNAQSKQTRSQQREETRLKAKAEREQRAKEAKRRKIVTFSSIGLVLAAIITVIVLVVVNNTTTQTAQAEQTYPANMQSDGVLFTASATAEKESAREVATPPIHTNAVDEDVTNITVYVDYSCPHCAEFENENANTLADWLDNGEITLEVHPVAVLQNDYSYRGANAAACVINTAPDSYLDFQTAAFEMSYNTQGLANRSLNSIVKDLDIPSEDYSTISDCINNESFSRWVDDATYTALNEETAANDRSTLTGTPTVLINGEVYPYSYDNETFKPAVEAIMAGEEAPQNTTTPVIPTIPTL